MIAPKHRTKALAETEVRLIAKYCDALYSSPNPDDQLKARRAIDHLGYLRRQRTQARAAVVVQSRGSASAVRKDVQRANKRFAELDRDGDLQLDFEEFYSMFPRHIRESHGEVGVRKWFQSADADGSGSLSVSEFFVWTLKHAAAQYGAQSLQTIFGRYDKQQGGTLDMLEFVTLCEDVGFAEHASEIFYSLDQGGAHEIHYDNLEALLLERLSEGAAPAGGRPSRPISSKAKEMLSALIWSQVEASLSAEAARELERQARGWRIQATDAAGVAAELRALLSNSHTAVIDQMRLFDTDNDSSLLVDDVEFINALKRVFRCRAPPWEVDKVFRLIDVDRSGFIGLDEMVGASRVCTVHA